MIPLFYLLLSVKHCNLPFSDVQAVLACYKSSVGFMILTPFSKLFVRTFTVIDFYLQLTFKITTDTLSKDKVGNRHKLVFVKTRSMFACE